MSKIDKLSILGIRSFSPKTCEVIEFLTPLTLIVGFNGSGKTTIIECLKYATTGEMPEGAKVGGAWIHDPKLTGERDTLGQVRLSFRNGRGERMILNRNVQLTVTRTSRSFKALETTLVHKKANGERESLSSKVGQINELVPDLLGVSKAVLENVIFCHQENSLWPMMAPNDLKKKFDDIFEAVKYTQAVDNIKKIRKEYADNLKTLRVIEANAKEYKDKGAKVEKDTHDLTAQIDELRDQVTQLDDEKTETEKRLNECYDRISQLSTLHGDLRGKRIMLETKQENMEKLKRNIKILPEPDAELQKMLDDFAGRVSDLESQVDSHRKKYTELQSQIQKTRNALSNKERELGSLTAQKDNYERQVEVREKLVKEIARSHNIRGYDLDISEDQVAEFKSKMNGIKRTQTQALQEARRKTNEELQNAQATLSGINERKTGYVQRKESANSTIAANNKRITSLQSEYDNIEVDEGAKATLELSITDAEERLAKNKTSFDRAGWDNKIQQINSELSDLDDEKDKLDAELAEGAKRAGEVARLEYLHKEVKDGETSLKTMASTHGNKIKKIINSSWDISRIADLEVEFQNTLSTKTSSLTEAERQRDGVGNELLQLNSKLRDCRKNLKKKTEQAGNLKDTIEKALEEDISQFDEELSKLEEEAETVMGNKSSSEAMINYFKSAIKSAKDHSTCRLCTRGFDKHSAQLEDFIKRLQNNIDKTAGNNAKQDAEDLQSELKSLRALIPSHETWKRLANNEIPTLEQEEKSLQAKKDQLDTEIESYDATVAERQSEVGDVQSLTNTIKSMTKYHADKVAHERQIKELEAKQTHSGQSRTLDQINESIKSITEKVRAVKVNLGKTTGDRDKARAAINNLELELRDLRSKLEGTSYKLKEREAIGRQIGELRASITEQREVYKSADEQLKSLAPELGQAQAAYDEVSRQGSEKDSQLRETIAALDSSLNRLSVSEQEINAYIDRDGPAQLHRTQYSIDSMKNELQSLDQKVNQITRDVKNIENQLRNNEDTKRSIGDNLDLRRDERDIEAVTAEIRNLESHNVEGERDRWDRECKHYENERLKVNAELNKLVGQLQEKDSRLQKNIEDWETDYKDAAYKYKEAHIRVETTKAAVEDLGRYGGALENAVMKYHTLKMEEVNRIIDELWRRTYQGTDVDTIVIKSENESQKGGKSYKYRVCMVKQDAEMDMRGRCSAGQKVLASIIIRLALAECFGVNCGLIALDEPTTNLDRDNIQALARALSEIIRVRRQQSNFQLIVITHDEEFLRYMQCSDYADEYYRVSRDANQDTEITRQSINYVMT
ncbi:DNA repair protein Rad50 [Elsinoe ampelina]|uniref:DNA repair protein RAD50 n=1 Tax=Elsinoe ampelina TaxID=302913 RepID=A0A6A6G9W7_9PEZI|nr:DNA repair protein Rad50 [Elsinoe ampelina]